MLYKTYRLDLVVLSVLIATIGAYVAIEIAHRVRSSGRDRRLFWISGGAVAMGLGIWSMHFVGMLALLLPVLVWYDALLLFLSFVVIFVTLVVQGLTLPALIRALDERSLRTPLLAALARGIPFLGVCLGLQALYESSAEAPELRGLGVLPGQVRALPRCSRDPGPARHGRCRAPRGRS